MSRNAQGNGSIRKRSNGTWEARYTIGRDIVTGKQVQKSVYGKTQQEVRKKLAQITTDLDNGIFTEPSKITLGEWLDILEKEKGGAYKFAPLKNDKCRLIRIPDTICSILERIQQLPRAVNPMNLVFVDPTGKHLIHKTVLSNYKAIAKKIGVPASRFHDLRHTFAVLSLQNGDSIKTLQENLGHATASFTMQTYAHVSDRMKKESADKMEAYITGIAIRA